MGEQISSDPLGRLASGKIDKGGTTLTLYRDGTFTTTGMIFTSEPDRLVAFSSDIDSMRRKSVTGRGAAFVVTGGMSILAGNNRGVIYVTITGELSGSKTYTTRNPDDRTLSSIRSLQAAADHLLASPSSALTAPTLAERPFSGDRERLGDGPYANHPALSDFPREALQQIADEVKRDKPFRAAKILRDALGRHISIPESLAIIEELKQLPDEGTATTTQLPDEGTATTTQPNSDIATQLKMLAELHATGALSDEEFAAAKARLLS